MSPSNPMYDLLPPKLGRLLALRDRGASEDEIAREIDTPVEGVGPLLELAEAKLASLHERFGDEPPFEIDQPDAVSAEAKPNADPRDG